METCMSNFKSVALTVLNWSDRPVRCARAHTERETYTSKDSIISVIHSIHLAEIINILNITDIHSYH